MDDKNLVNGSNALVPQYKPKSPHIDEEFERLKKANKEKEKQLKQKRLETKAQVLKAIAAVFVIGVLLISRYSTVYNLQKDLTKVKDEIHNVSMENESLKVQLVKASNMQQVEETAKTKLHMVAPDKNNVIYSQSTKDYFATNTEETKKNTKEDLIAKIKNMLF